MYTLFYSNVSEFAGNLEGMLDEVTYKTTIHNVHKIGWKAQLFKSDDVSMLVHGCSVSKYPQFYDRIKRMLPRPYVGSCIGEKDHQNFQELWIIALAKSVENFIMVSISDMTTSQYWKKLGSMMDKAK